MSTIADTLKWFDARCTEEFKHSIPARAREMTPTLEATRPWRVSEEDKARIVEMRGRGLSFAQIGGALKRNEETIRLHWHKHMEAKIAA